MTHGNGTHVRVERAEAASGAMGVDSAGFASSNTTGTPDTLFDYWLPRLTGAQLRTLLFLIRRCYGPTHQIDPSAVTISLPQFHKGTTGRDGRATCGCGIASKSTLTGALKSLACLGLIVKETAIDGRGGSGKNTYRLVVRDHPATRAEDGFRPSNTTPTPDDLFDVWLDRLSDAELRVLLYIVRHTLGWRKAQDAIDPGQFMKGIKARDGRVVDEGCGVKTREFLYLALGGLEKKGLVRRIRRQHPTLGNITTRYVLRFAEDLPHVLRGAARATPDDIDDAGDGTLGRSETGTTGGGHAERGHDRVETPSPAHEERARGLSAASATDAEPPDSGTVHINEGVQSADRGEYGQPTEGVRLIDRGGTADRPTGVQLVDVGRYDQPTEGGSISRLHHQTDDQETRIQKTGDRQQQAARPTIGNTSGGGDSDKESLILSTENEIRGYALGLDEVLLDRGEGRAQPAVIDDVLRADIVASETEYDVPVHTECFFSPDHFLGVPGDWTPDEERRQDRCNMRYEELKATFREVGAFSLEEALAHYFTADLVARYVDAPDDERRRVARWVAYVRGEAGAGITNPAGFLRTRVESDHWPPQGRGAAGSKRRGATRG